MPLSLRNRRAWIGPAGAFQADWAMRTCVLLDGFNIVRIQGRIKVLDDESFECAVLASQLSKARECVPMVSQKTLGCASHSRANR